MSNFIRGNQVELYVHDSGVPYCFVDTDTRKPIKIVFEGEWEISRNADCDVNCDDYYKITSTRKLTREEKQALIDLINGVRV